MAENQNGRAWLVPVFALFIASFAVGTAELIVAGILPAIAQDLAIDIPTAGTLIAGYALGVAIGGPLLALPTGRIARRPLLLAVMAIFVTGNVLCALAPEYWTLLGARLVVSASHGLFFGIANVVAIDLAPPDRKATAMSLIIAGITAASLVGLPIGTAIGNLYSWRAVFWLIALMGIGAAIILAALIPAGRQDSGAAVNLRAELRAVTRRGVLVSYLLIAVFIAADLTVYTYMVPMLTTVTGIPIALVPWLLFVAGIAGIFGNLAGGWLGDRKPTETTIGIFILLVGLYSALTLAMPHPAAMVTVCVLWWLIGFAFPAPVQARILKDASDAPNLASTLISTAFNLGIAGGAVLGGFALGHGWSYAQLPLISIAFAVSGLGIAVWLAIADRRQAASQQAA